MQALWLVGNIGWRRRMVASTRLGRQDAWPLAAYLWPTALGRGEFEATFSKRISIPSGSWEPMEWGIRELANLIAGALIAREGQGPASRIRPWPERQYSQVFGSAAEFISEGVDDGPSSGRRMITVVP